MLDGHDVVLHRNIVAELVADTSRRMKERVDADFAALADVGLASFRVLFMSCQRKSSRAVEGWPVPLWLWSMLPRFGYAIGTMLERTSRSQKWVFSFLIVERCSFRIGE